jgi:integrase
VSRPFGPREDGAFLHPQLQSKRFKADAKRAGLPVIRLHDLRHSYATVALEVGIPATVVAETLGHSSATTTVNLYSRVNPPLQAVAADLIAGRIFGPASG